MQPEPEQVRAALEALPDEEKKRIAKEVLEATKLDPTEARRRNAAKAAAARKDQPTSDKQKEAVRAYWAEYRAKKAAEQPELPKRAPGRPRKETTATSTASARSVGRPPKSKPEETEPKRPRGRPRKTETINDAQQTADALEMAV